MVEPKFKVGQEIYVSVSGALEIAGIYKGTIKAYHSGYYRVYIADLNLTLYYPENSILSVDQLKSNMEATQKQIDEIKVGDIVNILSIPKGYLCLEIGRLALVVRINNGQYSLYSEDYPLSGIPFKRENIELAWTFSHDKKPEKSKTPEPTTFKVGDEVRCLAQMDESAVGVIVNESNGEYLIRANDGRWQWWYKADHLELVKKAEPQCFSFSKALKLLKKGKKTADKNVYAKTGQYLKIDDNTINEYNKDHELIEKDVDLSSHVVLSNNWIEVK